MAANPPKKPRHDAGTSTPEPTERDERAAGTVDDPIKPGEAQPGDLDERAAGLGGPVDISPVREHPHPKD